MRREIENWWAQARADLEKSEVLLHAEKYDGAVFFCQQAAEKALKALFILKKAKSPGQTHSLIYLATEIHAPKEFYNLLQNLTPEFVTTRYPDVIGEVPYKIYNREKTMDYFIKTGEFLKWVSSQIEKQ